MNNLQKHTHSEYCHKNKSCHFGFPKLPATKTLISQPPLDNNDHMIENAKSVLRDCTKYTYNSKYRKQIYTRIADFTTKDHQYTYLTHEIHKHCRFQDILCSKGFHL